MHSLNKLSISAAGNQWLARCTLPATVALISYLPQLGAWPEWQGVDVDGSALRVETISYANVNLMSR